jgi:hypothetical protein
VQSLTQLLFATSTITSLPSITSGTEDLVEAATRSL